jgi:hypothetical protein
LCRRRHAGAGGRSNRGGQAIRGPAAGLAKQGDAAATLLDGEALGLTRKAIGAALAGDMLAMKLWLERLLLRCHERPNGEIDEPSPQNVSRAMNAVTTALACGEITPGEAATIAGVCETFVRTAGIAREKVAPGQPVADLDDRRRCRRRGRGHRRCQTHRRSRPVDGASRRLPARQLVEGSLFNLEEKSSCRFSADAGSGIALYNL